MVNIGFPIYPVGTRVTAGGPSAAAGETFVVTGHVAAYLDYGTSLEFYVTGDEGDHGVWERFLKLADD